MEQEKLSLFDGISAQLRLALSPLHLSLRRLFPPEELERDPALDARAAGAERVFYQLLRQAEMFSSASALQHHPPFSLTEGDPAQVARHVCRQVQPLAQQLGIQLRCSCAAGPRCAVNGAALQQLLLHLLSNALKASRPGQTVTVEGALRRGRFLLSVQDEGCGITDLQANTLLHGSVAGEKQVPHGLLLCRQIARGHHGTLSAVSCQGKGTRITLSLPAGEDCTLTRPEPPSIRVSSGFSPALVALADALPDSAYTLRSRESL